MLSTWYKNQFELMLNNGVMCELLTGIYSTLLRLTIVVRLVRMIPADNFFFPYCKWRAQFIIHT